MSNYRQSWPSTSKAVRRRLSVPWCWLRPGFAQHRIDRVASPYVVDPWPASETVRSASRPDSDGGGPIDAWARTVRIRWALVGLSSRCRVSRARDRHQQVAVAWMRQVMRVSNVAVGRGGHGYVRQRAESGSPETKVPRGSRRAQGPVTFDPTDRCTPDHGHGVSRR